MKPGLITQLINYANSHDNEAWYDEISDSVIVVGILYYPTTKEFTEEINHVSNMSELRAVLGY